MTETTALDQVSSLARSRRRRWSQAAAVAAHPRPALEHAADVVEAVVVVDAAAVVAVVGWRQMQTTNLCDA